MRRNGWILLVVVILAGAAIYQTLGRTDAKNRPEEAPRPHFAAPTFQLKGLDGHTYQVGGARDKALVINFWASWCVPCNDEAKDLEKLYREYQDRVDFYGVNITYLDSVEGAKGFVSDYGITYPTLLDMKGKVMDLYKASNVPTSFFYRPDRSDSFDYTGPDNAGGMEKPVG